ncbi:branched-chain amino acid ABC transporter substrate-binding protein [Liberibacter crescens]|uniref:branched-chain amino acid ABC transporter substrate-binding protein n=1 Tax=Liberibacter crescens TaxID=1273132 RepID=UPI0007635E41|nr:branched-chain amino acid ABC transporter substrate-binding protein [Liberibacter crescens]
MKFNNFLGVLFVFLFSFSYGACADIVIGVISPITGPLAIYGEQIINGVQGAVLDINNKGGILGNKVIIKNVDDAGEPKQGVSAANQLISEGVQFVIGPFISAVAFPVSNILNDSGVLMITPTASAVDLTTRGLKNVLRTCPPDDEQGKSAAKYVLSHFKNSKIAIIHDKTVYGKGLADIFKKTLNESGVKEQLYDSINPGEKDFSVIISHFKEANIDVLYFGGYPAEAGLILRQFVDKDKHPVFIGSEPLSSSELWTIARDNAEGVLFTGTLNFKDNPAYAGVINNFKSRGVPLEPVTFNAYAAVQVLEAGIKKVGIDKGVDAVSDAIKHFGPIDTIIGTIVYKETGDIVSQRYSMYTWKKGTIVDLGKIS